MKNDTGSGSNRSFTKLVANHWRWLSGGSVISIAVALGCATAVDFKSKNDLAAGQKHDATHGHDHGAVIDKSKRGVANSPGEEAPHNGGKVRMPISASFDGESSITISDDVVGQVMIMADADIQMIQGGIEGLEGLQGRVSESLGFTDIAAGETRVVNVHLPAKSGRIVVRIFGRVGTPGGETRMMSTSLELRVVNPKDVRSSQTRKTSRDMSDSPIVDSTGQVVQPMKAAE